MKRSGYNLPEDLFEEILLRLPSKYIIRLKCVCKSWNNLISDKKFINKHLHMSTNRANNNPSVTTLMLGWTCPVPPDPAIPYHDFSDIDLERKQVLSFVTLNSNTNKVHIQTLSLGHHLMFIKGSHCNGIVCLVDLSPFKFDYERIYFYNPTIRESWSIRSNISGRVDLSYHSFGFGYDHRADDYKFVRLLAEEVNPLCVNKAEVYTLGTDSWREIELDESFDDIIQDGVYLKGSLYWIDENLNSIISFDVSEEKFHRIPVPIEQGKIFRGNVAVWKESLVYFCSPKERTSTMVLEMWMMVKNKNNNGGVSWTKRLTIGPLNYNTCPIMFWKENELLIGDYNDNILSYNLNTKQQRKLPIQDALITEECYADFFVESLVPVKRKVL